MKHYTMKFLTKIFLTTLSIAVHNFWDGYSLWSTPFFWACPHVLAVVWFWCCSCIDTSHLVKQGYKATLVLAARVLLQLGGSTPCQGRRCQFIQNLTWGVLTH